VTSIGLAFITSVKVSEAVEPLSSVAVIVILMLTLSPVLGVPEILPVTESKLIQSGNSEPSSRLAE
jgi:hypothetical protein